MSFVCVCREWRRQILGGGREWAPLEVRCVSLLLVAELDGIRTCICGIRLSWWDPTGLHLTPSVPTSTTFHYPVTLSFPLFLRTLSFTSAALILCSLVLFLVLFSTRILTSTCWSDLSQVCPTSAGPVSWHQLALRPSQRIKPGWCETRFTGGMERSTSPWGVFCGNHHKNICFHAQTFKVLLAEDLSMRFLLIPWNNGGGSFLNLSLSWRWPLKGQNWHYNGSNLFVFICKIKLRTLIPLSCVDAKYKVRASSWLAWCAGKH